MDDELARVMKESMQDATAMILDNERAELEQAIQLSMQLEKEQQRLIAEEVHERGFESRRSAQDQKAYSDWQRSNWGVQKYNLQPSCGTSLGTTVACGG